ncbi:MAG: alpha/beta fold hydrolase [Steroidobacteraceae bacterium]
MLRTSWSSLIAACAALAFFTNGPAAAAGKTRLPDPRDTIASSQAVGPSGIHTLEAVEIGGIRQWISVRGSDPSNPILLFLHGGPGAPMMPESWTYQRPWEDFFTVVQWDQRGAGKTFAAANRVPDPKMTVDQMETDAQQLIDLLRHRYHKDRIFLMGHSWGSILGLRIAQHHPEGLYAYIGVGQVVNAQRNEAVGYQLTLEQARASGDKRAIRELEAIAPYPETNGVTPLQKVISERKWDIALGGMLYGQKEDDSPRLWRLSPEYNAKDVEAAQLGELSSIQILLPQLAAVDFDRVRTYQCPIVFFAGAQDRTTPESIVAEYYQRIQAPSKQYFRIERAAHYVVTEAPGEVLVDLVQHVRPLSQPAAAR